MSSIKEDRRVRITKQAIKESLIELLQKYPISKASVKMICETADINRSTFYTHYADQYELLKTIQQETLTGIQQSIRNKYFIRGQNEIAVPVLIQILLYAKANQALFQVLLSDNSDSNFENGLMLLAREKSIEELNDEDRRNSSDLKYIEIFVISGLVSIMREWLKQGCREEPEKLAELISHLLFHGVTGIYTPAT